MMLNVRLYAKVSQLNTLNIKNFISKSNLFIFLNNIKIPKYQIIFKML
jgi:hypothetical protein